MQSETKEILTAQRFIDLFEQNRSFLEMNDTVKLAKIREDAMASFVRGVFNFIIVIHSSRAPLRVPYISLYYFLRAPRGVTADIHRDGQAGYVRRRFDYVDAERRCLTAQPHRPEPERI